MHKASEVAGVRVASATPGTELNAGPAGLVRTTAVTVRSSGEVGQTRPSVVQVVWTRRPAPPAVRAWFAACPLRSLRSTSVATLEGRLWATARVANPPTAYRAATMARERGADRLDEQGPLTFVTECLP